MPAAAVALLKAVELEAQAEMVVVVLDLQPLALTTEQPAQLIPEAVVVLVVTVQAEITHRVMVVQEDLELLSFDT
jgi:hypothetical protein